MCNWDSFQESCTSLQPNEPWGDDFSVKCSKSIRVYFQNVNSLGLSYGNGKIRNMLRSLVKAECDIINIAQTSLNWKLLHTRNTLHENLRDHLDIYKLNVSRNKYVSPANVIPGGTAQIICGDMTGRIVSYVHDPRNLNRWCGVKLRLKHGRHIYIISAYRVCDQSMSQIGPETAFGQQAAFLTMEGIHTNPRKQFIIDLTTCVKEWQKDLDDVIIMMDANEDLTPSTSGLTTLMRDCHLIDLFHQHHGINPNFTTYDGGHKRLDYVIGSATILPFVVKCGYLPFYLGVSSDHRGLFLDLSTDIIDGLTRLECVPKRQLNSAFPKDVKKYKDKVHKEFLSHNVYRRAEDLYNIASPIKQEDPNYIQRLVDLDKQVVDIQLRAEEQCCRKRTPFDFSEEIHYTKVIINYWNIHRKEFTKKRAVSNITTQIYEQLPPEHQQHIDVASGYAYTNWIRTKKRLRTLMVILKQTRASEKLALTINEASYKGVPVDQVTRKNDRLKQDRKLYKTLRAHFHANDRSGLAYILVPDTDSQGVPTNDVEKADTWRTETAPQLILDTIQERNIRHFGQADGTPFTTEPLASTFGYNGMTSAGNALIDFGTMPRCFPVLPSPAQDVLSRLGDVSKSHSTTDDFLCFDTFSIAIKRWRESTSTSPSGRHLGHYKSLLAIDSFSSQYTDDNPDPGSNLLQVLYHVAASAFRSGLTLPRWQNITTCMIEKIPGTPRINKLRVIHLYEADYNAVNKLVWQRGVVWNAHTSGSLNKAQAGSRPAHTCIEVVTSKELKYLNSSLTRTPMATMDNDAKSCYDRIIASFALLVSNHFGVPETICQTVGDTLSQMQFRIRTAMGVSEQHYQHSNETPIHGVGQGGTASPAFWLLISSILFDCYQNRANGMTLSDPTNKYTVKQWLEALVDDTSLFTNLVGKDDVATLVRTLEADAQLWEQFLSVSGGCLELSKCFYYILAWTFTANGDPRAMSINEINALTSPISLCEFGKTHSTNINLKPVAESHKTLGVWKNMIGDDSTHRKYLWMRSNNMAAIIATSGMYPYQADVSLRMIYTTAMLYSLPAVNISEKALNRIQYKALEAFTPALGYNRNFPRAVLLGPSDYGGAAIPHLYTECKIQQLELIIMHIRAKTDLGYLFLINLNWIQLIIGHSKPYFENTMACIYIDNWFSGMKEFLLSIQGILKIQDTYVPIPERVHDQCIMEAFESIVPRLSKNQIRYMNNWRLFYKVQLLSDITNATGDTILDVYLTYPQTNECESLRDDRVSKLRWPYQARPTSTKTFQSWVSCLRKCFLQRGTNKMMTPLGAWTISPSQSQSSWSSYYDPFNPTLYMCHQDSYLQYNGLQRQKSCTATFDLQQAMSIDTLPSTCFPIMTRCPGAHIIARHDKIKLFIEPSPPSTFTNIDEAISNAAPWQHHLLRNYRIYDLDHLLASIEDDNIPIICVTDGGCKDGIGSYGVAVGTNTCELFTIEGPAPGNEELMTSWNDGGH